MSRTVVEILIFFLLIFKAANDRHLGLSNIQHFNFHYDSVALLTMQNFVAIRFVSIENLVISRRYEHL